MIRVPRNAVEPGTSLITIPNSASYRHVDGLDYGGLIYPYAWGGNPFPPLTLRSGLGLRRGFGLGWIRLRSVGTWPTVRYPAAVKASRLL
jgi:hypothetical protein